jgi:CDP-glucose 4,6-dehydratase
VESVVIRKMDLYFYKGKKVFITGHTGFKGSWLCRMLLMAGADITGYARAPSAFPNLFEMSDVQAHITHIVGDIRNLPDLMKAFTRSQPEIVFHLAAQPIVRQSYKEPAYTYETNVMGTVNILECLRIADCVKSFVNVTTDKVYKNNEWDWGYRESDILNGHDPYSNSKSCSELVTSGYRNSFFTDGRAAISTARAGNVIGGGDFSQDRIIPDCVRAAWKNETILVRNPHSTRPYQHVLEPLNLYLTIACRQYEDSVFAGSYNVGPDDGDCVTTGRLVEMFVRKWQNGLKWRSTSSEGPHEAKFLKLDCSKIKNRFGWKPRWNLETAVEKTVEWSKVYFEGRNIPKCMDDQIIEFLRLG